MHDQSPKERGPFARYVADLIALVARSQRVRERAPTLAPEPVIAAAEREERRS